MLFLINQLRACTATVLNSAANVFVLAPVRPREDKPNEKENNKGYTWEKLVKQAASEPKLDTKYKNTGQYQAQSLEINIAFLQ